jgi:hypothetical protein
MKLPMLPQDKANHFIYGLIIFAVVAIISNAMFGLGVCTIAAFAKELYDLQHVDRHTPDIYDAIWTIAGGVIGFIVAFLVK